MVMVWGVRLRTMLDSLACWVQYQEKGGLAYPPGGDLVMVSSIDSGKSWSSPLVTPPPLRLAHLIAA